MNTFPFRFFLCGSLFLSPPNPPLFYTPDIFCLHYLHLALLSVRLPARVNAILNMLEQENGAEEANMFELKLPDLLLSEKVKALHTSIENEWDSLQLSACQTAAGRALWKHMIHDPVADILAGEKYLRNLHEKIKKDRLNNAREVSGVILAVRTLWFDSKIETAINSFSGGENQVVLLGAGW